METREFTKKCSEIFAENDLVIQVMLSSLKSKFEVGQLVEIKCDEPNSWDGIRLHILEKEIRQLNSVLSMPDVWYSYKLGVQIVEGDTNSQKWIFWIDENCLVVV